MFTELITSIFAGLGGFGVMLWLRKMTFGRVPKWCLPMGAGVAMLCYQVIYEYNWYSHQKTLLPDGMEIISHIETESWWRPWSWFYPQTFRFIAADYANSERNRLNDQLVRMELYVVERRLPTVRMVTVVDCATNSRADYSHDLDIPRPGEAVSSEWFPLEEDDRLLGVCLDEEVR